jgi:hydrogenase nickel incorporation protein HypA/HybF
VHELAIIESLVDTVLAYAGDAQVLRVQIEIGKLTGLVQDALRFGFEVSTAGTTLAGAALQIVEIDGRGRCKACSAELTVDTLWPVCACGSVEVELLTGEELRLRELEVA